MRPTTMKAASPVLGLIALALGGCGPNFSPDTYASNAAQQANKVDQGVVVGVRAISISADATLGSATGAAAGGIAGSQVGEGAGGALGALGGSVAGGLLGNAVSHAAADTTGFEYIVRKPNGDLLSVTQKDEQPLQIGAHVLVIEGPQARIVIDYTVPVAGPMPAPAETRATAPLTGTSQLGAPAQTPVAQTPAAQTPAGSSPAAKPASEPDTMAPSASQPSVPVATPPVVVTPLPPPPPSGVAADPAAPPPQTADDKKPDATAKPAEPPAQQAPVPTPNGD
jgi:outer membrane lipoprotein SlyB